MNNRDIKSKGEYYQSSYIQPRSLEGNNFIYNQSNQGYFHKRNHWTRTDHASQNDKYNHLEQNLDVQKDKLPHNNYNKLSNSGNNSYNTTKFKDNKFQYGLEENNYYNKSDNYNMNNNNNSYYRNENKIHKLRNIERDGYEDLPKNFNKRNLFYQNQPAYQNAPKNHTRNYYENQNNTLNRPQYSYMPLNLNNFQNIVTRQSDKEFRDSKDYSNPVSFNSYNNSEIHNNTNSDKEKDKETETENTQSNKKMKISDKINFPVNMFNNHLNKTATNLKGIMDGNDKDTVENYFLNSTGNLSNPKSEGLYNKFNMDNRVHQINMIPFKTNNLKNLRSSNASNDIIKYESVINRNNNLQFGGQINQKQNFFNVNNFNHNSLVTSTRNNHAHLISQNNIFPRKSFLIPKIKYKNNPFMFVPKNLIFEDKNKRIINQNNNNLNLNSPSNPINSNFNNESSPQIELKNIKQSQVINYNQEYISNTCDIKLQEEQNKISPDPDEISNDNTRNNTEETSDKSNALLSINSEFFDGKYEENNMDPYSILDIKLKIGEDDYRELSLKQNDDIEQTSRDFCRENSLDNKFVPALCSMIHKAVDSLSAVFESDLQLEHIYYLNDIYNEYTDILNLEREMEAISLTNLSCLTVLDDSTSTDSVFKMSNSNLNVTM